MRTMSPAAPWLLCEVEEGLGDRVRVNALRKEMLLLCQLYNRAASQSSYCNARSRRLPSPSCRVLARCRSALQAFISGELEIVSSSSDDATSSPSTMTCET